MKCYTPMYRLFRPDDPEVTGKVISRQRAMEELGKDKNAFRHKAEYIPARSPGWAIQQIPCKNCWACSLNYSAEWATRIMLEAKKSPGKNFFITLTYDDEHLPILEKITTRDYGVFENDGTWQGSLYEPDMVRFINSLRKQHERQGILDIKYFYCGEYGEKTNRPHYHIILLNCPLKIEEFYGCHVDTNYKAHWKSKQLEGLWQGGMIDICELEWSCAAYVARYCTKKLSFSQDKTFYYKQGKMPEFIRMSKGIGFEWYREHKNEIYKTDEIIMKTIKGNVGSVKPPKAFDRKMKESNPELFEAIKKSRQTAAERAEKLLQSLTDRTDLDNLILSAEKVMKKAKMLPRVGEW